MADVAPPAAASPLLALATGPSTEPVATRTASSTADPFAALLAAGNRAAARPAIPAPPTPVALAAARPLVAVDPPASLPVLAGADDDDVHTDTHTDTDTDPAPTDDALGNAIDAGATAVLALVPALLPPMAAPAPSPVSAAIAASRTAASPSPTRGLQAADHHRPSVALRLVQRTGAAAAAPQQPVATDGAVPGNAPTGTSDKATGQQSPQPQPKIDPIPTQPPISIRAAKTLPDQPGAALAAADALPAATPAATTSDPGALPPQAQSHPQVQPQMWSRTQAQTQTVQDQPQAQTAPDQPQIGTTARSRASVAAPDTATHARASADHAAVAAIGSAALPTPPIQNVPTPIDPGTAAPVQGKADTIVQQTLTIARDGAWLDRLARDIASTADNGGNLQFKLDPQHLGSLSVAITHTADGASIRLTADNDVTRNILLDAQPRLIDEARAQGLKVSDTQVDLSQNQQQSQTPNHPSGGGQDASRWTQGGAGQNNAGQHQQNRQSSPSHQPFVSNPARKAETESESQTDDPDARYA